MTCCFCGGNDRPLHVYGQTDPGFIVDLEAPKTVYACSSCDPRDTMSWILSLTQTKAPE